MKKNQNHKKNLLFASLFIFAAFTLPLTVTLVRQNSENTQKIKVSAEELDSTVLSVSGYLHGIGNSGDAINPGNTALSTKNPYLTDKKVTIYIYSTTGTHVLTKTGLIIYDDALNNYTGSIDMGTTLTTGNYIVMVKPDGYLRKRLPGTPRITALTKVILPSAAFVAGDFNGDNVINVADYNIFMGCYSDFFPAAFCTDERSELTDISSDGRVNLRDYNLFLREISVQKGD